MVKIIIVRVEYQFEEVIPKHSIVPMLIVLHKALAKHSVAPMLTVL